MSNQEITVVYKWTAKPGESEELKAQMEATEPNTIKVDCYGSLLFQWIFLPILVIYPCLQFSSCSS